MDSFTLASLFNNYFITKIADIRNEFPVLESDAAQLSVTDFNAHSNVSHTSLTDFTPTNISLSARILHRAPPRLQVDQYFLTQKIVADPKMRCHQKSFGIWRVTEAILGQKTCF